LNFCEFGELGILVGREDMNARGRGRGRDDKCSSKVEGKMDGWMSWGMVVECREKEKGKKINAKEKNARREKKKEDWRNCMPCRGQFRIVRACGECVDIPSRRVVVHSSMRRRRRKFYF
jgi:hypothetical protein